MQGELASCESCVEHFYFQSKFNAKVFLDSCASAGLVEKVSLLDLLGQLGSKRSPASMHYDQSIYLSAPDFRNRNPKRARERIENTKKAVYGAFRLYYDEVQADDAFVDRAYGRALDERILRNADAAEERRDVALSAVAKLRLILDAFRNQKKLSEPTLTAPELDVQATAATIDYIMRTPQRVTADGHSSRAEELRSFIDEVLESDEQTLRERLSSPHPLPKRDLVRLLRLVSGLATTIAYPEFSSKFESAIDAASGDYKELLTSTRDALHLAA